MGEMQGTPSIFFIIIFTVIIMLIILIILFFSFLLPAKIHKILPTVANYLARSNGFPFPLYGILPYDKLYRGGSYSLEYIKI